VALHTPQEMPLRLGLLIDTSDSQKGNPLYASGVKAASQFSGQLLNGADDKVFILGFAAISDPTGFMNRDELSKFTFNLHPAGGGLGTALYDAVSLASTERMRTDSVQLIRRVLVIVSDGDDNLSHVTQADAIAAAQAVGAMIFTVSTSGLWSRGKQDDRGDKVLEQFASQTGGDAYAPEDPKEMSKAFASIKAKIEQMYSVTYLPLELGKPGSFRPIELKTTSEKKLKVHAPKRYYVPLPAQ
jgi:VWFA-related protein